MVDPVSAEEERDLIGRLRAGDGEAFRWFAEHYARALYRFASARVPAEPDLVRDVVQTTLCRFMEKLDSYRGESTIFTWLCAVCRNEIAMHFRRARRGDVNIEDIDEPAGPHDDPEVQVLERESDHLVHAVLDSLPPRYAAALEWKYIDGLSVRDIGERIGGGEKAAESLLSRARAAFRDGFDRLSGANP